MHADVENLLTEIEILQDFMLKDSSFNESCYQLINLLTAVEQFKTKDEDKILNCNIKPSYITSNRNSLDINFYDNFRSNSVFSTQSQRTESESKSTKLNKFK